MTNTRLLTSVPEAAEMLRAGELVAFPTETVYGLGADATKPESVARIFESKGRPSFDPLIVHTHSINRVRGLVRDWPHAAQLLAERFWPGPLTLVLPKTDQIPDIVTAGLPGTGLRIPEHPVARDLLQQADIPVAAPSANPFSGISPTTAQHVLDGLGGRIDAVLDGGPTTVGLESTVVSLMEDQPSLLRPGGLPPEEIEAVVGPLRRVAVDPEQPDAAQPAPGMLSRHYAPGTQLTLCPWETELPAPPTDNSGLLTWGPTAAPAGYATVERLSEDDCLVTCAANLFAAMRSLDSQDLDAIIAAGFPEQGLGIAMNDRLRRAASKEK